MTFQSPNMTLLSIPNTLQSGKATGFFSFRYTFTGVFFSAFCINAIISFASMAPPYANRISFMVYIPGFCVTAKRAARNAPFTKILRLLAVCLISKISSSPKK